MKRRPAIQQIILASSFALVISALVMSIPSAQAQKQAGPNRPSAVPEGYVITPFGYFHPSCVREVASGDTVLPDGRVQHEEGTVDADAPVCSYPRYSASGETVAAGPKPPTISHSWIASGNSVNTTSPFGALTANWIVPPAPTTDHGQTVFLFPGMEDFVLDETIIQPVLGWNAGFFGTNWSIASWNCCPNGTTNYSTPVEVYSGDVIFGKIESNWGPGKKSSTWNITTEDKTIAKSTTLKKTPSEGQRFTWAQGGALEVYEIVKCSDYPPNKSATFYNLALYDQDFNRYPNPGWFLYNFSGGLAPQCNYGGTMTKRKVTLDY
jgi:hypothetical protein